MNRKRQTHSLRFLAVLVLLSGMVLLSVQLYGQQAAPPSQQQSPTQRPGQEPRTAAATRADTGPIGTGAGFPGSVATARSPGLHGYDREIGRRMCCKIPLATPLTISTRRTK